ncbi:MAG: flagellar hook-associated protein FlgK [Limnochordia bacterium]|jgi:flagellar hook-associated protein 1 FlgK|nr:flagellar hook-associated protein FlgK [Limnochordia bacterium]MDD2629920.1 flagellar hook-associated protein FlgK [Limnochordia bacterium]MDD4516933.1 flagellar hook-associated protein FlgK [Limnochordia bacterium]
MSLFNGLEIAKRSMQVQRNQLNIANHNIANDGSVGYSRQEGIQVSSFVTKTTKGVVGNGVVMSHIQRARNPFYDAQYRQESQNLGYWDVHRMSIEQIEFIMNEPGKTGIDQAITEFRKALHDLTTNPQSSAVRASLQQQGKALTEVISHVYRQVEDLKNQIHSEIDITVREVNGIADEIAALNRQISKLVTTSRNANDLLDRRDLLLDQLSFLVDYEYSIEPNNSMTITIGGKVLVTDNQANHISALTTDENSSIVWEDSSSVDLKAGGLQALLDMDHKTIPEYLDALDKLATGLITGLNEVHRTGYGLDGSTGLDLFTGTGAGDIQLAPEIAADYNKIAASDTADEEGNAGNALLLLEKMDARIIDGGKANYQEYFTALIAGLGVEARHAENMTTNQTMLVRQLGNLRYSTSGVSLDEEVANIIKYQHAFNASARVVSVIDEMLTTLIERTGR